MKNFFRNDLNLKSKWWHRLLSSVYVLSLITFTILVSNNLYKDYKRPINIKDLHQNEYSVVSNNQNTRVNMFEDLVPKENTSSKISQEENLPFVKYRETIADSVYGYLLFLILFVLYYKIILYIIFGVNKSNQ
ncbi:MAG: hypothetical protein QG614_464 [Patescibacteria group bacterium]|nr:hypothetical protein [Patescibacteria group bacterium]